MTTPDGWGAVQDTAYHLERAVTKELSALLLVGADLLPQGRAVLREASDWMQMAHKGVESAEAKGKKRQAARATVLKSLVAAEKEGVAAAKLLFQEKVAAKDAAAACAAIAKQIRHLLAALEGLLALR